MWPKRTFIQLQPSKLQLCLKFLLVFWSFSHLPSLKSLTEHLHALKKPVVCYLNFTLPTILLAISTKSGSYCHMTTSSVMQEHICFESLQINLPLYVLFFPSLSCLWISVISTIWRNLLVGPNCFCLVLISTLQWLIFKALCKQKWALAEKMAAHDCWRS